MEEINGKVVCLTMAVPRVIYTCGSRTFETTFAELVWYSLAKYVL
jgi:hypothetical protein